MLLTWYAAITVVRGKFLAIQAYFKKQEKSQIKQSNLTPKGNRKRRTNEAQIQQKEGNNNDQSGNK